jgi:hypothetical protein
MKEGVMKEAYELPRIAVRGIVLERVMADHSCWPTIAPGAVEYTHYEDATGNQDGDILLF